jgi:hypothetical protein
MSAASNSRALDLLPQWNESCISWRAMNMKWLVCAILIWMPLAQACDLGPLPLVFSPRPPSISPVNLDIALTGDILVATFNVMAATINGKPVLAPGEFPYQFDVVEVFVSVDGNSLHVPYYEFELSAFNQTLQLKILDPKKLNSPPSDFGLVHSVQAVPGGWIGRLQIPLKNLGWAGDPSTVIGNAFAVLGFRPNRNFWSLALPPSRAPSFHQPQFFKPLITCGSPPAVAN